MLLPRAVSFGVIRACAVSLSLVGFIGVPASAQILPDTTLGVEQSQVNPNAVIRNQPGSLIEGGALRGQNIFHSFSDFNVAAGSRVFFANPIGVDNILSRVTGGQPSNIFGTLGVVGNANLFLMNPRGILFGPGARLDIAGSFTATTADKLVLGSGVVFDAIDPQIPNLLNIAVRPGLQYGTNYRGPIVSSASLTVGGSLELAAQNLTLQGQLQAGKDLKLQASEQIQIRDTVTTPFLAKSAGSLTIQGDRGIDILALSHANHTPFVSSGALSLISDGTISGDAQFSSGGSFQIRSQSGKLANFISLYDPIIRSTGDVDIAATYIGASLLVESSGSVRFQGDVRIDSPDLTQSINDPNPDIATLARVPALIVRSNQTQLSGPLTGVSNGNNLPLGITLGGTVAASGGVVTLAAGAGNITTNNIDVAPFDLTANPTLVGGDISITAPGNITIAPGATLRSSGFVGGSIKLESGGTISLSGLGPDVAGGIESISVGSSSGQKGGDINLKAPSIRLDNVGNISVDAGPAAQGDGGNINIQTQSLQLTDGSEILARTFGSGNAGNVTVTALDASALSTISLDGYAPFLGLDTDGNPRGAYSTGLFASTESLPNELEATGNGGIIAIDGFSTVNVNNGAVISARSKSQGNAQGIIINVDNLNITGGGQIIAPAYETGAAGDILINVNKKLVISGQDPNYYTRFGQVKRALNDTDENSRRTRLTVDPVRRNSAIVTSDLFGQGKAGNIGIRAAEIAMSDVGIIEAGTGGANPGGNILLQTQNLSLTSGAEILTQTFGSGRSGSILVEPLEPTLRDSAVVTISGVAPFTGLLDTDGDGRLDSPDGGFSSGLFITSEGSATGDGNTITIDMGSLKIADGAVISARSRSAGNGGDMKVNVNSLDITGGGQILSVAYGQGSAGNINVTASGNVNVSGFDSTFGNRFGAIQQAFIEAGSTQTSATEAASFTIDPFVDPNNFNPENPQGAESFSGLQATIAPKGGKSGATAGNIIVEAGSISVRDKAEIATSTFGQGDPGSIFLQATGDVTLSNQATIFSRIGKNAVGGSRSRQVGGGVFSFLTGSDADIGGAIVIFAQNVDLSQSSVISSTTQGQGNAGAILVVAKDRLFIQDDSGLFSRVAKNSTFTSGDILLLANLLFLSNGSEVNVDSLGSGQAGNIVVGSKFIVLDKESLISSSTVSGDGGNIILFSEHLVGVSRGSDISTNSFSLDKSKSGGAIQVSYGSQDNTLFVYGFPFRDSNILAKGFGASGGNIKISADAIRNLANRPDNFLTDDISTESFAGVSGSTQVSTLNLNPESGLQPLPDRFRDPRLGEGCDPRTRKEDNVFRQVDRGVAIRDPAQQLDRNSTIAAAPKKPATSLRTKPREIIQAIDWTQSKDGKLQFVAAQVQGDLPNRSGSLCPPL
jgi:filamentous hemagglutinin family protein